LKSIRQQVCHLLILDMSVDEIGRNRQYGREG
jgi:hypothetical protein